ncbi:uncharacterized protein LOC102444210 isoform X1 [Pelodiscus sinensis]|uniref:uncharacterized protein LOC102444210 isoform X1 n=1 Tax=Pelodiscus sinensis TaxID=13735 RepID=UPI003F6D8F48
MAGLKDFADVKEPDRFWGALKAAPLAQINIPIDRDSKMWGGLTPVKKKKSCAEENPRTSTADEEPKTAVSVPKAESTREAMIPEEEEEDAVYEDMAPETRPAVKEGKSAETATGPEETEKVYGAVGPEPEAGASDKENYPPPSEVPINSPGSGAEAEERETEADAGYDTDDGVIELTSSEDDESGARTGVAVICTCCFCISTEEKKKSDEENSQDERELVMDDIVKAVIVKVFYHCLKKVMFETCAPCAEKYPNPFNFNILFWNRSEEFYQLRRIATKLDVARVLYIIMAEGHKWDKLNVTSETVAHVIKTLREVAESADPTNYLINLSKKVMVKAGRSACRRIGKINPDTFYASRRGLEGVQKKVVF